MDLVSFSFGAGGPPFEGATWFFSYTPCTVLFNGSITGPANAVAFSATVNASTGAVVSAGATPTTCGTLSGPPLPIVTVLTLGFPSLRVGSGTGGTVATQGCTSGDFCYSIPILATSGNVTPADLQMQVVNANGSPVSSTVGFAILGISGQVVVSALGSYASFWVSGTGLWDKLPRGCLR